MKMYSYTEDQLTTAFNDAIDCWLQQLHEHNIITPKERERLIDYKLVVQPVGMFGRFWQTLRYGSQKEDEPRMRLVKVFTTNKEK